VSVRRASRQAADKPWVDRAARVGLAVRGVVFLVLAYLVARIASGALGGSSTKTAASGSGVAQAVAAQTGGTVMVFLLGVGLACYAGFSALNAALVSESSDGKRWAKRGQQAWRAGVYATFSVYAFLAAFTPQHDSGSTAQENREQARWSAEVLSWPAGWLWLGALGIGLLAGAGYLVFKAVRRKFLDDLAEARMSTRAEQLATFTGIAGHLGRAALYAIAGWFITQAAVQNDASDSQGVDGSIRSFADNAVGASVLWIVAVALLAFAFYMFIEARFRKV
jgi:hypothetical protein